MKIKIHQGETRVFSLLAVDDEVAIKVTSLTEVNLPTHSHEVALDEACGEFTQSNKIYLEFYGVNACLSGCYEITYIDECGTTIGFNVEGCITPVDGVEFIPTCCGGVITKTNAIATAYRPYNLNACDTISSHVRVVSSALIRKPAFSGSYVAHGNVFRARRQRINDVKVGAQVYIDGELYTICDVIDDARSTVAVVLDRQFDCTNHASTMTYNRDPIAVLGMSYKTSLCSACGVLELCLSEDDSYKLIPDVVYHWDVLARNDKGTTRLGGGTLELCETFTY